MTEALVQFLNGIPPLLAVFILSLTPVIELRAALPVAIAFYKIPLWQAFPVVVIGNMIPAFIILYGWDWCFGGLCKFSPPVYKLFQKWHYKTEVKWDAKIEKYGPLALILFVAIPLPGSGVWSGSLAAWIFSLNKGRALLAIFGGVLLAGAVVSVLTLGGLQVF